MEDERCTSKPYGPRNCAYVRDTHLVRDRLRYNLTLAIGIMVPFVLRMRMSTRQLRLRVERAYACMITSGRRGLGEGGLNALGRGIQRVTLRCQQADLRRGVDCVVFALSWSEGCHDGGVVWGGVGDDVRAGCARCGRSVGVRERRVVVVVQTEARKTGRERKTAYKQS